MGFLILPKFRRHVLTQKQGSDSSTHNGTDNDADTGTGTHQNAKSSDNDTDAGTDRANHTGSNVGPES